MSEQLPSPLSVEQYLQYGVPGPQAAEAVITDIDEQLAENNVQYVWVWVMACAGRVEIFVHDHNIECPVLVL